MALSALRWFSYVIIRVRAGSVVCCAYSVAAAIIDAKVKINFDIFIYLNFFSSLRYNYCIEQSYDFFNYNITNHTKFFYISTPLNTNHPNCDMFCNWGDAVFYFSSFRFFPLRIVILIPSLYLYSTFKVSGTISISSRTICSLLSYLE